MRLFAFIFLLLLTTSVWAGHVNREQARAKAHHFLMEKGRNRTLVDAETRTSAARSRGVMLPDYYYVFNAGEGQGFVIVSADDRTSDILGYCPEGSFDADKIPSNMAAWLQGYEEQIKYVQENDCQIALTRSYGDSKSVVSPLIKTKWAQGTPYNNDLPLYNGRRCITGCTATALAQVMYYYQYPTGMTTEIPGYTTSTHRIKVNKLPATTFNWTQMTLAYNGYTTSTQNAAVAHLMEYCSKSILSDLDPNGTGSYSYLQRDALLSYFGYDKGLKMKDRNSMSNTQWVQLLYEEVSSGRPVLYAGFPYSGSGHAFVLDGYDGDGMFHFNWGWSGYYDGYFKLDALTPGGSNYNYYQKAVVGIKPPYNAPIHYDDFTKNGIHYHIGSDGRAEVTKIDANTRNVDILETVTYGGKTYQVSSIGKNAFEGHSDITYLSIPSSIESIGEYAFVDCGSTMTVNIADPEAWCEMVLDNEHASPLSSAGKVLVYDIETKNIEIPSTVTTIGKFTFYQCRSITSLSIPSNVKFIGSSAFEDCTGLTSITFNDGLEYIGGSAFEGCSGLSELTIPSTVGRIELNAFKNCTNLYSVVSEISDPFEIEDNVFEGLPTSAVLIVPAGTKSVYEATDGWDRFETIVESGNVVPGIQFAQNGIHYRVKDDGDVEVTEVDPHTKIVDIPEEVTNGDITYRVSSIGEYAFEDHSDINYLSIPSTIKSIGEFAFIDCGNSMTVNIADLGAWCQMELGNIHSSPLSSAGKVLVCDVETTDIQIPNTVTSIGNYTFYQCRIINSLSIPGSVTSIGSSAFEDCSGLTSISLAYGNVSIGGSAFEGCTGLTKVTIPGSVNVISINSFKNCSELVSVISEIQYPSEIDESAFEGVPSTVVLQVPKGTKSVYQSMEGWDQFTRVVEAGVGNVDFSHDGINYRMTSEDEVEVASADDDMKVIVIPETIDHEDVIYHVTAIGESAFEGRSDISYLSIPSSITSIGEYAFIDCGSNINVDISNIESWCKVTFGNEHASPLSSAKTFFSGGKEIKDLVIPDGVESISGFAFYQCRSITSLHIPESVKTIGSSAFEDCTGLTSVSLLGGVETIGGSSFEGCTDLSILILPSSITTMSINAFKNCSGLSSIVSFNNDPPLCTNPFYNVDKVNCTLWVPKGCALAYQDDFGWKDFANIRELVEGDLNLDEVVDQNDMDALVEFVMGKNPEGFYVGLADLNGDNKIDAADVVKMVDLVRASYD